MPGRSSAWSRSRRARPDIPVPPPGGRSRRRAASGSRMSIATAASGSTPLARFLQDVAIDDVQETGWGMPEHLWFLRRIRIDVLEPFLDDPRGRARHLVQRPRGDRGRAALVAPRRRRRPRRGRQRLDPSRPGAAAGPDRGLRHLRRGRRRAACLDEARAPRSAGRRAASPWPLRATDVDVHGHVNNAVYWQAVEHVLPSTRRRSGPSARRRARLPRADRPRRRDRAGHVEPGRELLVGFRAADGIRAVARVAAR